MNYADFKKYDIANGPGVRVSLFVSGCTHACKGCFNQEAWDFQYGKLFTQDTIDMILKEMEHSYYCGITILGGEPFEHQNQKEVLHLLREVKKKFPEKSIWCYSGYLFDRDILDTMVPTWPETKELLSYIDVLVDGEFVEELHNVSLRFRGSSNQRIIMVQESLKAGEVLLWDPNTSM